MKRPLETEDAGKLVMSGAMRERRIGIHAYRSAATLPLGQPPRGIFQARYADFHVRELSTVDGRALALSELPSAADYGSSAASDGSSDSYLSFVMYKENRTTADALQQARAAILHADQQIVAALHQIKALPIGQHDAIPFLWIEIGDDIVALGEIKEVFPSTPFEGVITKAADQNVVALAAIEGVITLAAIQNVITGTGIDAVITQAGIDCIGTPPGINGFVIFRSGLLQRLDELVRFVQGCGVILLRGPWR